MKTTGINKPDQSIWLVYDGSCPLCRMFGKTYKLREACGELHIINGREMHPLVAEINQLGFRLDEGIVLKFNGLFYHGADALHMLALLGSKHSWFNRLNAFLFRSKIMAKVLYPLLKCIRNVLLMMKGVSPINNLIKNDEPIFKPVFGEDWEKLPAVFCKHYANRPFSNDVVIAEGKMDIAWTGVFGLLAPVFKFFNVLVPYQGKNVPVMVYLRSDMHSRAYHFERVFHFPNKKPYYFRSFILPVKNNVVVELMPFGLGFKTRYECNNDVIKLKHDGYVLKIGGLLIHLPLTFLLGKVNVEKTAISEDMFSIKMEMVNKLFGNYLYTGIFKVSDV